MGDYYDDYDDDYYDEEESDNEESDEELDYVEREADEYEDTGYESDTIYDAGYGADFNQDTTGLLETDGKRYLESPWDISMRRVRSIINENEYVKFKKYIKNKAIKLIENLPENMMILYNVDILTPASIIVSMEEGTLNENMKKFMKDTNGLAKINHLDLIRYVRFLSKK